MKRKSRSSSHSSNALDFTFIDDYAYAQHGPVIQKRRLARPAGVADLKRWAKAMHLPTKTIDYRGGVVSLEIPAHWKEEYEPKGGGTFYEDRPDSGTLRLNVLGFARKDGRSSEDTMRELIEKEPQEILACGFPLKRYMKEGSENGETLHLYRWEVSVPVPPSEWRIACFVHTIVAGQEGDPRIKAELDLIDGIVRSARFSTARGVIGDYHQEGKKAQPGSTDNSGASPLRV